MKECIVCGEEFEAKRADARFDKEACKKKYQRSPEKYDGTPGEDSPGRENIKLEDPVEKKVFTFRTPNFRTESGWNEKDGSAVIRQATRWYDVPLSAVPIVYEGEPEMPEWMNGRQYFLWRENNFKMEGKRAVIINPNPSKGAEKFYPGGQQSRQWGA